MESPVMLYRPADSMVRRTDDSRGDGTDRKDVECRPLGSINFMEDPLVVKPDEKVIVVGRDNNVLYTDYEPSKPGNKDMHLLDLIDNKHKDVLKIIADAMDRPGAFAEGNVIFRSEPKRLRVVHQPDYRTHIIFAPPNPGLEKQWKILKPK